ncbi:cytochrome P450 [Actinomadura sp. HBU206391]|uniref:cytochrome P450 n=1 Tax=Actinomadura sp. HBU206391 TaxID=2731692 RepID=UPI00164FA588|nr:cytochrome P450 [Actinomadura sp. HBU206391]MBC6461825.1 cytochrome P450 [Actinomadura sp. HBU206391]
MTDDPNQSPDTTRPPSGSAPPAGCPAHNGAVALYGPRYQENPAELYREMRREHGPVVPVVLQGDIPAWLVIGYRELHHVLSNPQLFARDARRWNAWDRIPPDWPLMPYVGSPPSSLLSTEGAEHQRRVGVISDALAAVDQFSLKARCEELADRLIDNFAGRGEADLITDYAKPIPVLAVAKMFGLPDSEAPGVVRNITTALDGAEGAVEAFQGIGATMQELLDTKRERPGPDIVSRMLAHPAQLSAEELSQDLLLVLTGAQEVTANWIGNALRLMLTDDRFALTLSGGRRSAGQALNEVLWEDTPGQNSLGRWAVRDTQLGGRRIKAGDAVIIGMAGANADPQVRPDSYSGSAGNHAHLSFSHGEHGCPHPAPELGEVIAHTAVEVLLDRLPDVMLSVAPEELTWRPSFQIRALSALPVKFTPAHVTGGR